MEVEIFGDEGGDVLCKRIAAVDDCSGLALEKGVSCVVEQLSAMELCGTCCRSLYFLLLFLPRKNR